MSGVTDIFNLTDTWDDAGEQFTAIKMDVTKSAAASGSKLLNLLLNGASKLSVAESGQIVSGPLTFPITDGTNGQALVTNGSGVLSWGSISTGSPFTVTGTSTAGAEIRLPEDTDNGSNYVALKAADSLAANLTFTLPSADGTNGQALVTNGSGVLSWASVSAGSPFTVTGTSTAGAEIRLPEDTDNGSNYVALKAPDTLSGNVTFTLPNADGTNGQALTTNGSGVLSWATIGASAPLTLAGGTVTANAPPLEITQTWNNSGITFQGLKINVTRTAAAANSAAFAVQIGGSNVLRVVGSGGAPDGILFGTGTVAGIGEYADHLVFGSTSTFNLALNSSGSGDDKMLKLHQGGSFGWSSVNAATNTADLRLTRSAANVLQIAGASSAPAALFTRRFTVTNLPAASSYDGCIAHVSDASATTPRTTVSGGGSNKVMVMSDGTNWLIVA